MARRARPASSSAEGQSGFTLMELAVVLAILAVLAALAAPSLGAWQRQSREEDLRTSLREIRQALDRFHEDWAAGRIVHNAQSSADGWPVELTVLVEGVPESGAKEKQRWYLRRIPLDPMDAEGHGWALRGYQDRPDADAWDGEDVFDVRSRSQEAGSDGRPYVQW